jgi:hypothetical protein
LVAPPLVEALHRAIRAGIAARARTAADELDSERPMTLLMRRLCLERLRSSRPAEDAPLPRDAQPALPAAAA